MSLQLDGRRILVTGAGRGIGREICRVLASKTTAKVFALSRTADHLQSLTNEFPDIVPICVDLANWTETRAAVESVLPIDGLVNNNAGIACQSHFFQIKPQDIDRSLEVNVKAIINVSQVVAQSMKDSGEWRHHCQRVVTGPLLQYSPFCSASQAALKDHTVYCGTKGAVDSITRCMALELGPFNIRVNAVNPTMVNTDMGNEGWADPSEPVKMLNRIPLGRFAA